MTTINITKLDIKNGKRNNPSYCPIALAVTRVFKIGHKAVKIAVRAVIAKNDNTYYWKLKKEYIDWIDRFDAKEKVKPFSFKLGKPNAIDYNFTLTDVINYYD